MGVPITKPKNITIYPEHWALEEVEAVRRYRAGDKTVEEFFFENYSGWNSLGTQATRKEKQEDLKYKLTPREAEVA